MSIGEMLAKAIGDFIAALAPIIQQWLQLVLAGG